VTVTQVPLSGAAAMLIGLAALGVTMIGTLWGFVRHGVVMAHEGGHAATAALMGRKVDGIDLNSNGTGETRAVTGIWPGTVLFFFVGYLGPSLFGIAAAKMIELGHIVQVLWIALFLVALMLLAVRTGFGVLSLVVAGGLVFLVLHYTPVSVQIVAAYAITWLLVLSGLRVVLEHGTGAADAAFLRQRTFVPKFIWFLLWLAGSVTAIAIAGKWMILRN
jgi:hypothetical protein